MDKISYSPTNKYHSGCDILLIKIQSGLNLTIGVTYVSPSVQFGFDLLNNIIKDYFPIIFGDDFNVKHISWNNFSNKTRGVQLFKYIQNNDIS